MEKHLQHSKLIGAYWLRTDWFTHLFTAAGRPFDFTNNVEGPSYLRNQWVLNEPLTTDYEKDLYNNFISEEFLTSFKILPLNPIHLLTPLAIADIMQLRCDSTDFVRNINLPNEMAIIDSQQDLETQSEMLISLANEKVPNAFKTRLQYLQRVERINTLLTVTRNDVYHRAPESTNSETLFYCELSDAEDELWENPFATLQATANSFAEYIAVIDERLSPVEVQEDEENMDLPEGSINNDPTEGADTELENYDIGNDG